jgi:hypothetical protein
MEKVQAVELKSRIRHSILRSLAAGVSYPLSLSFLILPPVSRAAPLSAFLLHAA